MDIVLAILTAAAQLGMGAGAWKLANALKLQLDDLRSTVTDHGHRITKLETPPLITIR